MEIRWPTVDYAELFWPPRSTSPDPTWSKRRRRANKGKYRQAQVPFIADLAIPLTPTSASAVQATTDDITRFDAQYEGGAPFEAVLLRSESSASSEIEQLTANARRIALARLGDTSRHNATLIARNTGALETALELASQLDVEAILSMHRVLLEGTDPDNAGTIRDQQVWIGGDSPVTAMFVPPEHTAVPAALDDLVKFMQRTDVPPLAQAAIAHAQFETIHPFTDGNGRTGRALVSAVLRARGTTRNFTVPLSSGLLTNTAEYFDALTEYRHGYINPIIDQFVHATQQAMGNAQVLLHDIDQLRDEMYRSTARKTKNLTALATLCTTEPAFTASMVRQLGVPTSSAYRLIDKFVDQGILRVEQKIKGQAVWSVKALTKALDDFAYRAGRRIDSQEHWL